MTSAAKAYTAEAASNIAFIKYWGARDLERVIPMNPSISMTLDRCRSICCAEFEPGSAEKDEILVGDQDRLRPAPPAFRQPIERHLDRLRHAAGQEGRFRIATRNTFPSAAGIASSASGFAALTLAVVRCLELRPSTIELSAMARKSGSGSAARSVFGGYVEWPAGPAEADCVAKQLAAPEEWDLRDVIAITQSTAKKVSSRQGHERAASSPHFATRQRLLDHRLSVVRRAIRRRDLEILGPVLEEEAIELHLVAMSSKPPIFYWCPATLSVLDRVRRLREQGTEAYATMDAGPNVHIICSPEHEDVVADTMSSMECVERVIRDRVGGPPVWRAGTDF